MPICGKVPLPPHFTEKFTIHNVILTSHGAGATFFAPFDVAVQVGDPILPVDCALAFIEAPLRFGTI